MQSHQDNDQFNTHHQGYQDNQMNAQNKKQGNQQNQRNTHLARIQEEQIEQSVHDSGQNIDYSNQQSQQQLRGGVGLSQSRQIHPSQQSIQFENPVDQINQPNKQSNGKGILKKEEEDDDDKINNVKLQKILKDTQNEEYLRMIQKQQEKMMEKSMHFDELPILSPDLELLKLRMDEAELISGLTQGVFADLMNIPDGLPEKENLDLKSVNGFAIQADSFLMTNAVFKKKLQKSQLYLTIQVPIFEYQDDGTQKIFYDQLFVECRRQMLLEQSRYEFNQTFPCKLTLNENNIAQFTDSRIFFILYIGQDDPSSRIEFARGEFRFDQLLLKPYLRGAFEIPLIPSQDFEVQNKNSKGNTKNLTAQNKTKNTNTQKNTLAGELSISVALLNNISPYAPQNLNLQPSPAERQRQEGANKKTVKKVKDIPITNIPFQIFLSVSSLSDMQRNISVNEQILIRHKIYGRNENLEGLMKSVDNQQKSIMFSYKSIMPVDPSALTKMNTIPFILEIWKKNKVNSLAFSPNGGEQLLGMIRLNMKSIPELVQNPEAFASNLYPTMLVEGEMPIWNPSTNGNIGVCNVTFAFGTVSQVHFYDQKNASPQILSQPNKPFASPQQQEQNFMPKNNKNLIFVAEETPLVKNQQQMFIINQKSQGIQNHSQADSLSEHIGGSQISQQERPIIIPKFKMIRFENMEYSKEAINKVFVLIMENIRRNKRRAQNILRNFILKAEKHEKRVTLREFYDFLNEIPIQEVLNIKNGYLHKLISVLDFEESGEVNTNDFVRSYNSFLNYEDILRDSYSYAVKEFSRILVSKQFSISDFERILMRFSEFGFVKREFFKNILEKDFDCESLLINRLIDLLDIHEDGLIQANILPDYLRSIEVYEKLNYIHCDSARYAELVKQNLQENLLKNEEGVQELIMNDELADKEMHVRDIQYLVQGLGLDISFWESACIIESIRLQLNIPVTDPTDEFKLPFVYLSDWLQYILKQKKEDPQFNYYSYLVEQRNRLHEEQLLNNQISERKDGQKSVPISHRNNQQQYTENSSNKYTQRSQGDSKQQQKDNDEEDEDLIMLVKNNYKKQ